MIRRILRNRIDRFWEQEKSKHLVRTIYNGPTANTQKLGMAVGVTLYQPEKEKKYPYIEYKFLECVRWELGMCVETMSYHSEGTPIYWYVKRMERYKLYTYGFVALVKQGVNFQHQVEPEPYEIRITIENAEKIIDTDEVCKPELRAELSAYAVSRGWSIARKTYEENLIAIWCVKNGILNVLETPTSTNALSVDERIALEEEECKD